jgi:hypothetical protein
MAIAESIEVRSGSIFPPEIAKCHGFAIYLRAKAALDVEPELAWHQ